MPKMRPKNNPARALCFSAVGLFFSVIPATVAIFSYFPLWLRKNDASSLSGLALLLLVLAFVPLFKYVKEILRSASAPFMWFILFVAFFLLSRIADEITVIAFVGFISNLIGSVFFKLAKRERNVERT